MVETMVEAFEVTFKQLEQKREQRMVMVYCSVNIYHIVPIYTCVLCNTHQTGQSTIRFLAIDCSCIMFYRWRDQEHCKEQSLQELRRTAL